MLFAMSRALRIEFPGAVYHVTSRGIEGRGIVADDRDRGRWLAQVERVVRLRRWRVFAFALMGNHFHLFLQTPEPNLSVGMRDLNSSYASYFNTRHSRAGHLFQGRYRACLVEGEGYWLEVSRYVHLNPVRAGLVAKPERWTWSSYPGYHRPTRRLAWVDYERVLKEFGGDTAAGRRRYREFIAGGLGRPLDSPLATAAHGLVLGSDQFVERIQALLDRRPADAELPVLTQLRPRPQLPAIVAAVAEHYGCDPSAWVAGSRCDHPARCVAAYLARHLAGETNRRIAQALGYRNPSSVTVACRRIRRAPARSRLAQDVRRLAHCLSGREAATNH